MREIVLDTETTGLNLEKGNRIIEIGALELLDHMPTGRTYQQFVNPEFPVEPEALAVHGISDDFLKDKPLFKDIVDDFLEFIQEDTLVIHNASFDVAFLNKELSLLNKPLISFDRVIDTVALARKKVSGSVKLDTLCKKFNIDNSRRVLHGALLDSEILADVYLELLGGKQRSFELQTSAPEVVKTVAKDTEVIDTVVNPIHFPYRSFPASEEEVSLHNQLVVEKIENSIWKK